MHVAIIIGGSLLAVGAILYVHHRISGKHTELQTEDAPQQQPDNTDGEQCCGMHITCERDSLSPVFADEIVYFDDEELDVYAGRSSDSYSADETERFRDVLLTLLPDDIAPWARSIQQRGIELPDQVRDELFMIVNEERSKRASK